MTDLNPACPIPAIAEFYCRRLHTHLLVENDPAGGVTIRSTRDNFSPRRKAVFVRELAAEGFIPAGFEAWANAAPTRGPETLRWVTDASWLLTVDPAVTRLAERRCRRTLLAAGVLWVAVLTAVVLQPEPRPPGADHLPIRARPFSSWNRNLSSSPSPPTAFARSRRPWKPTTTISGATATP